MEGDGSMIAVGISTREQFDIVKQIPQVNRMDLELECFSLNEVREMIKEVEAMALEEDKGVQNQEVPQRMMTYVAFPRMFRKEMEQELLDVLALNPAGVVVRTIDELAFVRKHNQTGRILCDYSVYAYNEQAALQYQALISDIRLTLPVELNREELSELLSRCPERTWEWIVYGAQPVMISAQCLFRNTSGCTKVPDTISMWNQHQDSYRIHNICKYCYNVIYEKTATSLLEVYQGLSSKAIGGYRIQLTDENADETMIILNTFVNGVQQCDRRSSERLKNEGFRNAAFMIDNKKLGHYKKGIE